MQRDSQRHHQPREVAAADEWHAADAPEDGRGATATASPTRGSGMTCLANKRGGVRPNPKNAAWPSETMPA